MPLTIHCSMCGANIEPDDQAVRREVVTCSHCSTVQRITSRGMEKTPIDLAAEKTHEGVHVVREGSGNLILTARHTRQAFVINKPELIRGTLIGLAIGVGITILAGLASLPFLFFFGMMFADVVGAGLFLLFLPVTFFASLISVFVLAKAQQNLPPLRLKEKILYSPTMGAKSLAANDIRQIYSTATKLLMQRPIDSYMVYALTQKGERVFLLGPLDSAESALFIEELLEVNMQLLNLPVYGDTSLPRRDGQAFPVSPQEVRTEGLTCEGCGAEMIVVPQEKQRGFTVCWHCGGLMLLYADGGSKPILGIPGASKADSQFAITTESSETVVSDRRSGNPAIRLSNEKMQILTPGASRKIILRAEVKQIQVRETGWVRKDSPAVKELAPEIQSFQDAMAYSGDFDPVKVLLGMSANKTYALSAVLSNGEEVNLLEGIQDIGEAFFLKRSLLQA